MRSTRLRRSESRTSFITTATWSLRQVYAAEPRYLTGLVTLYLFRSLIPVTAAFAIRSLLNSLVATTTQGANADVVYLWLTVSFALALLEAGSEQLNAFVRQTLTLRLSTHFSLLLTEHTAQMQPVQFESPAFQDIASRASTSASTQLFQFVNNSLVVVTQLIEMVTLIAALLYVEPLVVPILAPIAIAYLLFQWRLARLTYLKDYQRVTRQRTSRYLSRILADYNWVFEVHLLALPRLIVGRFRDLVHTFLAEDLALVRRGFWGTLLFVITATLLIYATFFRTLDRIFARELTVGDVALYLGVVVRLRTAFQTTFTTVANLRQGTLYIADVRRYLAIQPDQPSPPAAEYPSLQGGSICLENVSFTYPGARQPVLKSVTLSIEPGQIVALVGHNGSGKTTLAKLLAGFYRPTDGRIKVGDTDLEHVNRAEWQRRIGFVFQRFNQFETTVHENIAFGNWDRLAEDGEGVRALAVKANLDNVIAEMPHGYKTQLGRLFSEFTLSTGQWQKIAVARALARDDALLLILDEPTASLDAAAEYEIFNQFRQLAAGRTTVLISHRFSTVRLAEKIYVLDEGVIVESGTHAELLAANGHYAHLYQLHARQLAGD